MAMASILLRNFGLILLLVCVLSPIVHLSMTLHASKRNKPVFKSIMQKGISILIPCYNEESILNTCIKGISTIDYTNYEVIYINDGSTDNTMEVLSILLDLVPENRRKENMLNHNEVLCFYKSNRFDNVFVIDKLNGGKADSLNAGTEFSKFDLVVTLDADSVLKHDSLHIINNVFSDENVIAGGGSVRILQGANIQNETATFKNIKHIVKFQILEYMKGFNILKVSLSKLNALSVISGAFGVFNRQILLGLGGYRKTVGEDIDITIRFQNYIYKHKSKKMVFMPNAICYTECPESWKDLYKQRVRWQKAFVDCIIIYRKSLFKTMLTKSLSFFMVVDSLLAGTVATFTTLLWFMVIAIIPSHPFNSVFFKYYIIYYLAINFLWSILAFITSKNYGVKYKVSDVVRYWITVILDLAVFRLINCFYIVVGTTMYFFNRHDWNKVKRTGRVYNLGEKASM